MQHNVAIGPWSVLLLPASVDVPERGLYAGADEATLNLIYCDINPNRKQEVLRSRWLLRNYFGMTKDPVRTEDGDLKWPKGFCGSISHKNGHIAAAVLPTEQWASVGVDIEIGEVSERIGSRILAEDEARVMNKVGERGQCVAAGFATKEAIFKAIFPLGRQKFFFEDATIQSAVRTDDVRGRTPTYRLEVVVGAKAGGPANWDRKCEVHLILVEVDEKHFWLAACGMRNGVF